MASVPVDSSSEAGRTRLLRTLTLRNERAIARLVKAERGTPAYRKAKAEIDKIALEEFELRMPIIALPAELSQA